jgi:hypothetical protein
VNELRGGKGIVATIERENCVSEATPRDKEKQSSRTTCERKRREKHALESSAVSVCESKEKLGDFSLAVGHIQRYLRFSLESLLSVNS